MNTLVFVVDNTFGNICYYRPKSFERGVEEYKTFIDQGGEIKI